MRRSKKAKRYLLLQGVILIAFAASCSYFYPRKPRVTQPHEDFGARAEIVKYNVPYVGGKEKKRKLMLDIYSNPHGGLQPVVVAIHGGAWIVGGKNMDNMVYVSKSLAGNGYVVFNINYRLAPLNEMRRQVEDAMAAVIWVKEHAAEYGGDPERVSVVGGSAGGHIAALVAWASDDPYFTPTGDPESKYDSDVKVAALYYPVIDVDETLRKNTSIAAPLSRLFLTGSAGRKYREALKHLSPHNHIDSGIPPTLFLCGDEDSFKLYPQAVKYEARLRELGVDTGLYTAPGKGHGFTWQYWIPESHASVMEAVAFFNKYLK